MPNKKGIIANPVTGQGDCRSFRPPKFPFRHRLPLNTQPKTKVITLCGSSRFVDVMAVCAWFLERDEFAITMGLHLLPKWYKGVPEHHLAEAEGVAEAMDQLHLRKIDISDEVYVINFDNYVGESTAREIEYAIGRGVPVRYLWKDQTMLNLLSASYVRTDFSAFEEVDNLFKRVNCLDRKVKSCLKIVRQMKDK